MASKPPLKNPFIGVWDRMVGKEEKRILMVGLDAAGKRTILYKMQLGENVTTFPTPTTGSNVESVDYKNINMTIFDVGGQDRLQRLWRHYYTNVEAIIFVVDSNDVDRMEEAAKELHGFLGEDEVRDAALLVYANKQDLPNAMKPSEVSDCLNLLRLRDRPWYIQACCATNGDGLYEGLDWLSNTFLSSKRNYT